jgi:hypothetical protein
MQLIWISGSTSSMKQIRITRKTVIKIALLSFSVFILIGMSIHFFGFRVAIRFNPEMAKEMGGVISRKEMDDLEVIYRQKIQDIQTQLPMIENKILALKDLKDQFAELSIPTTPKN